MSKLTELLSQAKMRTLKDGTDENEPLQTVTDNRCGAYARVIRPEQTITSYACAGTENNYYPGNIIRIDGNFLTKDPTIVPFRAEERKPLDFSLSTGVYLPITEDPFKNVVPTERNMNQARNRFAYLYAKECASRKLGNNLEIEERSYNSGVSLNVGGTIKGVDFSIGADFMNRRTKVFILKQKLYTVSLDNIYKDADDLFTDKVDIDVLEKETRKGKAISGWHLKTTYYPLGIIQDVSYGRMAVITVSSKNSAALNAKISEYLKLDLKGGTDSCEIKIRIIGGSIAGYADGQEVSGETAANKIISYLYTHQLEAVDIETAKPMEYKVNFLNNMRKYVTTKILPYSQAYVEQVRLKILDDNYGASFQAKLRCLDVKIDANGKPDYVLLYKDQKVGFETLVSPRAICFEIKVDTIGAADKYDKNVFCPRVPLEQLLPDDDGYWTFRMRVTGRTEFNNTYSFDPLPGGCYCCANHTYLSKNGVLSKPSNYVGRTERECLIQYYSWCEWHCNHKDYIYKLIRQDDSYLEYEPRTEAEKKLVFG